MTQVQSLSRAFSLLEQLAASDMGLTLTDLSACVGLAPSTVHRLLNSLKAMGYVECDGGTNLWSIGVQSFSVGNAFLRKRDFAVRARPFMKDLVAQTGETANLAILDGCEVVYVAQVESKEVMRVAVQVGSRGTVYATGVGKSLLSALAEKDLHALLKGVKMTAFTDRTCVTKTALYEALKTARIQGYTLDDEEQSLGLRCVATNIYDAFGDAIAALSISGPSVRVSERRIPKLVENLLDCAAQITAAIGGRPPVKNKHNITSPRDV